MNMIKSNIYMYLIIILADSSKPEGNNNRNELEAIKEYKTVYC